MASEMQIPFAPDEGVQVHQEGAIRLICASFRSHEAGLPEWLKNASDMYIREDLPPDDSLVLLIFRDGTRGAPSAIGCLDFGGMTTEDIERRFRHWADPEASGGSSGAAVEGGHGNGGKCYMTQMFESHSYVHTLKAGRASKYGFRAESVVPGYFPSVVEGRGYPVSDPDCELSAALGVFGLRLENLPENVQHLWERRHSFTLVAGIAAREYPQRRLPVRQFVDALRGHQQMTRTIQRSRIYVYRGNEPVDDAYPLALPDIRPLAGAENPRVIQVPDALLDPDTGETVETDAQKCAGRLVLQTSDTNMRYSLRARHTINGWSTGNRSTGFWDVPDLSRAAYANRIYGDLYLDSLENYKQNDRQRHSVSPLTRGIRQWLTEQIDAYSAEFVKLDHLQASQEERDELSRINKALDAWKNGFLEREFGGVGLRGRDGKSSDPHPHPPLPRGTPATIELRLTHQHSGQGLSFKPQLRFIDADGRRIRPVPHEWRSSDWAVATVDGELNAVTTHSAGITELSVVCNGNGVSSNSVRLEVVEIRSIELKPPKIELPSGKRMPIEAQVTAVDGRLLAGVYLTWVGGDDKVVSVSSSGMVFGIQPGKTTIHAGDDRVMTGQPAEVVVTEAERDNPGGGYPLILLSEIENDPDAGEPATFSSEEPPVHQRPQDVDRNIWWINMASPLARRYVDVARGGGARAPEWRAYLIERYVEVMVKILLTYDFEHGEELTFETMLRRWDEEAVNMQRRIASSLMSFLDQGRFPE